jgi:signal transduction histidine kinase
LVSTLREAAEAACESKGLTFRFDTTSCLPTSVMGDAGRVQQVLQNLVDNAIRHSSARYVVQFSVHVVRAAASWSGAG